MNRRKRDELGTAINAYAFGALLGIVGAVAFVLVNR